MTDQLKLSTARNVSIFMAASADHIAGVTGLVAGLTITASKDGAAFAAITPTVTDLGSGWYNLALTATHTNTAGDFVLHITGAACDPTDLKFQVALAGIVRDVIMDYAFRAGRTVRGWIRRADALSFGKTTGQLTSLVTSKQPDAVTTEFTVVQDLAAGTREAADTAVSETP